MAAGSSGSRPSPSPWTTNPGKVPDLSHTFIENWVNQVAKVPQKVHRRGYGNFCEGYIFNVEVILDDSQDHVHVKAQSYRSMRKNATPYHLQVLLSATPAVLQNKCDCECGKGHCNHVVGLLYLLCDYQSLGFQTVPPAVSKTSLPQTWNVHQRSHGLQPRAIENVFIQQVPTCDQYSDTSRKRQKLGSIRSSLYCPIPEAMGDTSVVDSLRAKREDFSEAQLWTVLPPATDVHMVPSKFGLVPKGSILSYQQQEKKNTDPKIHIQWEGIGEPPSFSMPNIQQNYQHAFSQHDQCFYEGLHVPNAQSVCYEAETREQSNNAKWFELKKCRLSSSKFKDIACRRKDFDTLACRMLKPTIQTAAMKHGILNEENAACAYADKFKENVYPCGLVINPSCPHLATSPDRRVYDPNESCPWGLLEVKCPVAENTSKLHYFKKDGNCTNLRPTHVYFHQVMGQMMLTGAEWVDFYVWCKNSFHCERIYFDGKFASLLKNKLDKFYFEHYMSALMKHASES